MNDNNLPGESKDSRNIFEYPLLESFSRSMPFAVSKPWEVPGEKASDGNNDEHGAQDQDDEEPYKRTLGPGQRTMEESRRALEASYRGLRHCEDSMKRSEETLERLKRAVQESHRAYLDARDVTKECAQAQILSRIAANVLEDIMNGENKDQEAMRKAVKDTFDALRHSKDTLRELNELTKKLAKAVEPLRKPASELNQTMEEIGAVRGKSNEAGRYSNEEVSETFFDSSMQASWTLMDIEQRDEVTDDALSFEKAQEEEQRLFTVLEERRELLHNVLGDLSGEIVEMFRLCKNCEFFRDRITERNLHLQRLEKELEEIHQKPEKISQESPGCAFEKS